MFSRPAAPSSRKAPVQAAMSPGENQLPTSSLTLPGPARAPMRSSSIEETRMAGVAVDGRSSVTRVPVPNCSPGRDGAANA